MSEHGVPVAEKDKQGRVHVAWKDGRRRSCMPVVQLTADGADLPLPGHPDVLKSAGVAHLESAVLFAERRSGVGRLVHWLLEHCGVEGVCVRAPEGALAWSPRAEEIARMGAESDALRREWISTLRTLSTCTASSVTTLMSSLADRKDPLFLVLRLNDSRRTFDQTREFVSRLRACYEEHRDRLRLVLATSWPDLVIDTLEQSGFISIGNAYRLASFGVDELRAMTTVFPHLAGEVISTSTLHNIRRITGGQPHLVECLLRELAQIARHHASADTRGDSFQAALDLAQQRLAHSPPAIVAVWQDHLAGLLHEHPELRLPLERYVENHTLNADLPYRYPPPRSEWHLYVAGWVGPDPSWREWGIRSLLHREWARQVLAGGHHG